MQRHEKRYQLAVYLNLEAIRGEQLWEMGLCPMCGRHVSLRKRSDSVYCSKRCRTRAWRLRKRLGQGGRDASERSSP